MEIDPKSDLCRFCPFCGSANIIFWKRIETPEEDRDTETYGCYDCRVIWFRERMDSLAAEWTLEVLQASK